ncbi:hypothetical protein [Microbacterium sp. 179-I 3D3 NHS]|uniref:hypothetical protein n=1 Tax=unclassified Microbacterium TaxID=2609290 RepID=UPI0039A07C28
MTDEADAASPRQRVVRVPGARRARLTPVPGSDPTPEPAHSADAPPARPRGTAGPNDDRLVDDVPPHY